MSLDDSMAAFRDDERTHTDTKRPSAEGGKTMSPEIPMMFALALLSVGMWTLRVAVAARGLKLAGAAIAATEAVVFALTFSRLVTDLGSPGRLLGYAAGVAAGTAVGLAINDRTARGHSELHLVAAGDRGDLVACLRARGWPATTAIADGPDGVVTAMWLTVPDRDLRDVSALITDWAPGAFWTVRRLQRVANSAAGHSTADQQAHPTARSCASIESRPEPVAEL
jgi:uncharacterized protein YebE (UPF0316 family)